MVRRNTEPNQAVTLTGATNKQEFPARVTDDSAQDDNRKRVQATKEADLEHQTLPEQRESKPKPVSFTLAAGTKVTASKDVADRLKRS